MTVPVDGRLRGPDFQAKVIGVAWPAVAGGGSYPYVVASGDRLVVLDLQVTQPVDDVENELGTFASTPQTATAAITFGATQVSVDLSAIGQQILGASDNEATNGTGSGIFVVSVPAHQRRVDLVMSEGSFSQSLDLWTLQRVGVAPAILYRDPSSSIVSGNTNPTTTIDVTDPSEPFTETDNVTFHSLTLSAFSPAGSGTTAPAGKAYLSAVMEADYPASVNDDEGTDPDGPGHYLAGCTPLPGTDVTFSAPGGSPVTASTATAAYVAQEGSIGSPDVGLLDYTYYFTVPADTTTGTLAIGATTTAGYESLYDSQREPLLTLTVGATTLPLTFPAVASVATQPKPHWIGAQLPPSGSAAASLVPLNPTNGTGGVPNPLTDSGSSGSGGHFPIWAGALVVLLLAAAVVLTQRQVRRRRLAGAVSTSSVPVPVPPSPDVPAPAAAAVVSAPGEAPEPGSGTPPPTGLDHRLVIPSRPPALRSDDDFIVGVLGPLQIAGWREAPDRTVVEQLVYYLALHSDRPTGTDALLAALWSADTDDQEVTPKTLRNYLSKARQAVGPERPPEVAGTGGYRLTGVITDWQRFGELEAQADRTSGWVAARLRAEALSLVRGQPFAGATSSRFQWVSDEHLARTMTVVIVKVAHRLAGELLAGSDLGKSDLAKSDLAKSDLAGAEWAARQGLLAQPDNEELWTDTARAVLAGGSTSSVNRLWREMTAALGREGVQRVKAHLDADAS